MYTFVTNANNATLREAEPDWDQTLTIIRVNEEKKISQTISGTEGIRKQIMITRR